MRSTPIAAERPGESQLEAIVRVMAPELGWVRKSELDKAEADNKRLMQRPPQWLWAGCRERDDYGETKTFWFIFQGQQRWTDAAIQREVERFGFQTEDTSCHHSYDCCGRWYCDGLYVKRIHHGPRADGGVRHLSQYILVRIGWGRNV